MEADCPLGFALGLVAGVDVGEVAVGADRAHCRVVALGLMMTKLQALVALSACVKAEIGSHPESSSKE